MTFQSRGIMSLEPRNGSGVAFVFVVTASHPRRRRFWDSFSEHWRKDWLEFSTEAGKFQYYVCIIKCFYFLNFLLLSSFSNVVVTVHYFFFCPNLALPYSSRCRACPLQLQHAATILFLTKQSHLLFCFTSRNPSLYSVKGFRSPCTCRGDSTLVLGEPET